MIHLAVEFLTQASATRPSPLPSGPRGVTNTEAANCLGMAQFRVGRILVGQLARQNLSKMSSTVFVIEWGPDRLGRGRGSQIGSANHT